MAGDPTIGLRVSLKRAGHKLTPARLAVIRVLEAEGKHLTPAEVLQAGRAHCPELSRATVYRTLELLTEMGLLRPIYLGERGNHVARVGGGHQHLVCLRCGAVTHLDDAAGEAVGQALAVHLGPTAYEVRSFLLELYGTCADCCHDAGHNRRGTHA
ncbi:MAG: Fur family transcriptional regulator [Anaerolineae bacterium]